jgi:phosphoribosyl 1,2-cyclic phosphodiesterase
MIARFWGVRGTVPVPGPDTLRYGGNTSCVSIDVEGLTLVLDAGTGIRALGRALRGATGRIAILPTHAHIDHVLGFPFFIPLYEPGRTIDVVDYRVGQREWSLLELLDGFQMPLSPSRLEAQIQRHTANELAFLREYGLDVTTLPLNHPGGSTGFRVAHGDASFVYLTDNELQGGAHRVTEFDGFVNFVRGAEVLVHDSQYVAKDLPAKAGWGHSTVEQACELAIAANVGQLVVYHHDPYRTDDDLDAIGASACAQMAAHGLDCAVACEGWSLAL